MSSPPGGLRFSGSGWVQEITSDAWFHGTFFLSKVRLTASSLQVIDTAAHGSASLVC